MAGSQNDEPSVHQRVTAGRDAYVAGGDMHIVSGGRGVQIGSGNVQNNYYFGEAPQAPYAGRPATSSPDGSYDRYVGQAFISYVREDAGEVDDLQRRLDAAGIPVWRAVTSLWPGEDWRAKVRRAISEDALVFIACFSSPSAARRKS